VATTDDNFSDLAEPNFGVRLRFPEYKSVELEWRLHNAA
jgi:hypothetical protein